MPIILYVEGCSGICQEEEKFFNNQKRDNRMKKPLLPHPKQPIGSKIKSNLAKEWLKLLSSHGDRIKIDILDDKRDNFFT